jgi:hypothetical protein
MYNDNELKSLLAKMLPETVHLSHSGELCWSHNYSQESHLFVRVLDTELLRLCSLVEAGLTYEQAEAYDDDLFVLVKAANAEKENPPPFRFGITCATWQQRVTALASVKGVTL